MEKVKVNEDVCIGCGACQVIANEVFEINDEGLAEVIKGKENIEELTEEVKEEVIDALEGCPTGAIVIEKEDK